MPITAGQTIRADDFINQSERNATPASDNGRVAKLENGGKISPSFTKFGGDGSDGALNTSGGVVNINCGGERVVIKQYTSINIVTNNLTFSNPHANGTIVILKSQGDVVISATIDLSGMGAAGGTGGTLGNNDAGDGNDGNSWSIGNELGGNNGIRGFSGDSPTGSVVAPDQMTSQNQIFYTLEQWKLGRKNIVLATGSGGGGGGAGINGSGGTGTAGANGGRGGGALLLQCAGDLNFTGTIDVSGQDGSDASNVTAPDDNTSAGAGGGGGSAGMAVVLYESATATSGTINNSGGDGGDGGDVTNGGGGISSGIGASGGSGASSYGGQGGAGAGGVSGADGGNGSNGGNTAGGGGGAGAGVSNTVATRNGGTGGSGGSSTTSQGAVVAENTEIQ